MTNQLQVPVPSISAETALLVSLMNMGLTSQARQLTTKIASETGEKQSAIELELYVGMLCSCTFGVVCEASKQNIPLREGQSRQVQEKLKQLVINLLVNELQDKQPQPSQN